MSRLVHDLQTARPTTTATAAAAGTSGTGGGGGADTSLMCGRLQDTLTTISHQLSQLQLHTPPTAADRSVRPSVRLSHCVHSSTGLIVMLAVICWL